MRFEIASVWPSFQAFQTCGTKLDVDRRPATVPSTVGSHPSIARSSPAGHEPAAPPPVPTSLRGRKLVFVITEDWFFASHFLPMARAARELGIDVAVVTRVRSHREAIEATGARVIPLEAERSSLNPMTAGYAAGQLASILKAERADLVHCIALRAILIGGFAASLAGVGPRI